MIQTPIKGHKILVISDIHYELSDEEFSIINNNYDACFALGDIPKPILRIIAQQEYSVYGVLGNHDTPDFFNGLDVINIHNSSRVIGNYNIIGLEGSSIYKRGPYVMHDQKEIRDITKNLPYADILLSHDSPWHMHDTSMNKEGFIGITKYIKRNKPLLHIYGHHHVNAHQILNKTLCICNYRFGLIDRDGIYYTGAEIIEKPLT